MFYVSIRNANAMACALRWTMRCDSCCDELYDGINDKDAVLRMRMLKRDLGSHLYFIKNVSICVHIIFYAVPIQVTVFLVIFNLIAPRLK